MNYLNGSIVMGCLETLNTFLLLRSKGHIRRVNVLLALLTQGWLIYSGVVAFSPHSEALVRGVSVMHLSYSLPLLGWGHWHYRKELKKEFSDKPLPLTQYPPVPVPALVASGLFGVVFAGVSAVCLTL